MDQSIQSYKAKKYSIHSQGYISQELIKVETSKKGLFIKVTNVILLLFVTNNFYRKLLTN